MSDYVAMHTETAHGISTKVTKKTRRSQRMVLKKFFVNFV